MIRRLRPLVACGTLIAAALTLTLWVQPAHAERIFIDAGHGGSDPGASYAGVKEADVNLQIALRLRSELQSRGHSVSMSRTSNAFPAIDRAAWSYNSGTDRWTWATDGLINQRDSLQARCDLANSFGADVFISVHNNAADSAAATGYETYHQIEDPLGAKLALSVHQEVLKQITRGNRGDKTASFYVLRWTHMPAVLVECGFLSNAADRAYVTSASGQNAYARGMAAGIDKFLASDPYTKHWPRIAGATRYGTAADLATTGWDSGAETVLLATGENWPDALASAPLSKKHDAPLLLTMSGSLPAETSAAIARLKPKEIVILGGTDAVASSVASAAAQAAGIDPSAVRRIDGSDRYETATLIAAEVGVPADGRVCVVTGTSPADAVSVSAYAGAQLIPIVLVKPNDPGAATARFLTENADRWTSTLVIGGTVVIGDSVTAGLPSPVRLAGADRYATNTVVLDRLYTSASDFFVANGEAYPDCLTAGVRGAKNDAAIMLVKPRTLSNYTREYIENNELRFKSITMVGGTGPLPYLHDWMIQKAIN